MVKSLQKIIQREKTEIKNIYKKYYNGIFKGWEVSKSKTYKTLEQAEESKKKLISLGMPPLKLFIYKDNKRGRKETYVLKINNSCETKE